MLVIIDTSKRNIVIDKNESKEVLERVIQTNPRNNYHWEIVEVVPNNLKKGIKKLDRVIKK